VDLGDQRLNHRLVALAQQRGAMPTASIAQSCGGLAGTRAAYRFYDHEGITLDQIQRPHRQATLRRLVGHPVVLAVQDTTQVNLTHHPHTAGMGYLQDRQHQGYLVHTTLMVTPQRVPLGILHQRVWVRDPAEFGKRHQRHQRATSEKESQKWLDGMSAVQAIQADIPDTLLVNVGDSEADIYALFAQAAQSHQAFLVRACRDRLILNETERHLWQALEQQPVLGSLAVAVPRQANRPARTATVSIRLRQVALKVPVREKDRLEPAALTGWAIVAREEQPPAGVEAIEWKLLTNVPTPDFAAACERVCWYSCRWVVEMFHRVLKSGCRLEERQFDDLENIQRFLAVDSVVAWHVLYATLFSREAPQWSCEVLLEPHEWQALYGFTHHTHHPPPQVPTLAEATRWIARLGGFTGSSTVQPGTTVMWRGFSRLTDIAQTWSLFHETP